MVVHKLEDPTLTRPELIAAMNTEELKNFLMNVPDSQLNSETAKMVRQEIRRRFGKC